MKTLKYEYSIENIGLLDKVAPYNFIFCNICITYAFPLLSERQGKLLQRGRTYVKLIDEFAELLNSIFLGIR